jgi:hypothetical protein
MKRTIITATAALLALAGLLAPAQQASAATRFQIVKGGVCPVGYLCAYPFFNGQGIGVGFYNTEQYWANADAETGVKINNYSWSWMNRGLSSSKPTVTLFDYGFAGEKVCLPNDAKLHNATTEQRDLMSANLWDAGCR